jgi:hypothetical protein
MNSIQIIIKMNHNTYRKQFSAVVLGLFLLGMTNAFGQINHDPLPPNNSVTLDNKTLWEHGFTSAGVQSSDEDTDMVTVGSTMPYFIMPDQLLNVAYFAQSSYSATGLTQSTFTWEISTPANGDITALVPNTTQTSPWVEIKWKVTGTVDVTMVEGQGGSCESDPVTIPVKVIQKPEIMFDVISGERTFTECVPDLNARVPYPFPVAPVSSGAITESSDVKITYDIDFVPLNGSPSSRDDLIADVSGTSFTLGNAILSGYGTYTITIKEVSDKTSRKCTFDGGEDAFILGTLAQEKFVYTMLPKPTSGKAYHVPNN